MKVHTGMIAAVLHDVLEDSDYTPEKLVPEGIPGEAVKVVQHLSRTEGEPVVFRPCL